MAVATTSNYSPLSVFVDKVALERAKPLLCISKFGKKVNLPTKSSKTIKFSRYERIAPTTGKDPASVKAVVEGTVPSDVNPTRTDYTAVVAQYGNVSRISDQATWTNETDVNKEVIDVNSENMVQTIERVYWAGIVGGTSVFRLTDSVGGISGAARVNVAGKINAVALDKAVRLLQRNDAKTLKEQLDPSSKIGTQGIRAAYIAVIHPDVKYDLEQVPGFIPVAQYPAGQYIDGEVGSYKEIRFVQSTLAQIFPDSGAAAGGVLMSTTGTNADVYAVMIMGKDAYAVIDLASSSQSFYIPNTEVDHSNPIGNYSSIGWKAMCTSLILNDNWILRFECAASV